MINNIIDMILRLTIFKFEKFSHVLPTFYFYCEVLLIYFPYIYHIILD